MFCLFVEWVIIRILSTQCEEYHPSCFTSSVFSIFSTQEWPNRGSPRESFKKETQSVTSVLFHLAISCHLMPCPRHAQNAHCIPRHLQGIPNNDSKSVVHSRPKAESSSVSIVLVGENLEHLFNVVHDLGRSQDVPVPEDPGHDVPAGPFPAPTGRARPPTPVGRQGRRPSSLAGLCPREPTSASSGPRRRPTTARSRTAGAADRCPPGPGTAAPSPLPHRVTGRACSHPCCRAVPPSGRVAPRCRSGPGGPSVIPRGPMSTPAGRAPRRVPTGDR